jgi:hypothetical protein
VWEEKPATVNTIATNWILRSLTAGGGRLGWLEIVAPLRRCPGVQQSMGHLASSGAAEKAVFDSGAAAPWW